MLTESVKMPFCMVYQLDSVLNVHKRDYQWPRVTLFENMLDVNKDNRVKMLTKR